MEFLTDVDDNVVFSDVSMDSSVQCSSVSTYGSTTSLSSLPTVVHTQPTITTLSAETLEAVRTTIIGNKAIQANDAAVPIALWDMRIPGDQTEADRTTTFSGLDTN